ncbi:ANL_HP_G0186960.mRNA.1.CDS.1 [Saccharomyces cerevisiae]|nr:ANL_HP_G0186960.mRNA.1.CDS.1 [Saccharomyces cerevisiae]CAI6391427.1 ANL_HP_G0186960.mRNA.1.CDS.1 [Saccharomyces cerevisiae]
MNPQGSCSFGTPIPITTAGHIATHRKVNTKRRSSANKYHHFQGKNSYSGAIPKRSDDSNSNKNEGIRRASVDGSPSSRDTDSVEMKFDKLNI